MVEDDLVREVRAVREAYARSLGYDARAIVADLRARDLGSEWTVVRHPPRRPTPAAAPPATPGPALQQTAEGASS